MFALFEFLFASQFCTPFLVDGINENISAAVGGNFFGEFGDLKKDILAKHSKSRHDYPVVSARASRAGSQLCRGATG